jgi:hypothetical protein
MIIRKIKKLKFILKNLNILINNIINSKKLFN